MALWGNSDNIASAGTVSLNYATKKVTGSGTDFGGTAKAKVGDIIRFGFRGDTGTFFGDAVISTIDSTTVCYIASTDGLSGAAIAGTSYYVSELPIYSVDDHVWSEKHSSVATYGDFKKEPAIAAQTVGHKVIPVKHANIGLIAGADALSNGGNDIVVSTIGTGTSATTHVSAVGVSTIYVKAPAGVRVNDNVDNLDVNGDKIVIASIGATSITGVTTVATQINAAATITFNSAHIISLASNITAAISDGEQLQFRRLGGGYDRLIYAIGNGVYDEATTSYRTENEGWVGVTTYMGVEGEMRVKKECLVAMSGITTGDNGIIYPTPPVG